MIFVAMPYADDMDLGAAYNAVFELLPDDAWACLLDHDMAFTTGRWRIQLDEAIRAQPRGTFTAMTNRMSARWQVAPESAQARDDFALHRRVGQARLRVRTLLDVTDTQGWGGVLMLLSKRAWARAGGFASGLLCVDHMMHYALKADGERVWCIEGLYVYHVRGTTGGPRLPGPEVPHARDRSGRGCPCRGVPHGEPSRRVRLP